MNYKILGYVTDNREVKFYIINVMSPEATTTNYGIKTVNEINMLRTFEQVKKDITTKTADVCMTPCKYDTTKNKIEFPDNIKRSLIKTNYSYFDSVKMDKIDSLVNDKANDLVTQGGMARSYCDGHGIPLFWSGWVECKSGRRHSINVQKMFDDRLTLSLSEQGPNGRLIRAYTVKGLNEVVSSILKIYKYA